MKRRIQMMLVAALVLLANGPTASSQTSRTKPRPQSTKPAPRNDADETATRSNSANRKNANTAGPNLARERTLYIVGYAHLDTEWRWEYPQVIQEYLTKTMRNNFALFEKYPHYIFNFTGANRYRLMKEYYPSD